MIISLKRLVKLLEESGIRDQGVSPGVALAIDFDEVTLAEQAGRSVDQKTFTITGGGTLVVDIDKSGEAISIEVVG